MKKFGKVAVLMGGQSSEREISLLSGTAVLEALLRKGVDAQAVDPQEDDLCRLKTQGFARAFIALHGAGGENGCIQGLLESIGLPYTGSGVMASALAMDKTRSKQLWQVHDLPTPPAIELTAAGNWKQIEAELGLPLIVKPVHEGSSMGIVKITAADQLAAAWQEAARFDARVMIERFVSGTELTVAFLGERILPAIRIEAPDGNYDYENKYFNDETRYFCPAGLDDQAEQKLNDITRRAVQALGASGWGRVDLIRDESGKFWLLELNTAPGMTSHSLVPMAAKAVGMDFDALCCNILAGARCGQ